MSQFSRNRGLAALVLVALGVAACDGVRPTAPSHDDTVGPSASHASTAEPALVAGTPPTTTLEVSGIIGSKGGALKVAEHKLNVPRGAVDRPTLFTMRVGTEGYVIVDLTAYQQDASGAYTIDVGERGFAEALHLKLSYAWASGVTSPDRLRIVWLEDGTTAGHRVLQPTSLNVKDQRVQTLLRHFSSYALAAN